ncbi:hypothetical protein ACJX0J_005736 [Zea mays]
MGKALHEQMEEDGDPQFDVVVACLVKFLACGNATPPIWHTSRRVDIAFVTSLRETCCSSLEGFPSLYVPLKIETFIVVMHAQSLEILASLALLPINDEGGTT